jgi:hypothetical protein
LILRHGRRRLIAFGVTAQPLAEWIARQNTEAFPWDGAPKYLIRDRAVLWSYGPGALARDGHPGSADCAALALAERPC